jgi:hypothetical protein
VAPHRSWAATDDLTGLGFDLRFGDRWGSLLEVAEPCDVPADWSCRTGMCHRRESAMITGPSYTTRSLSTPPPRARCCLCSARPLGDVTLDL